MTLSGNVAFTLPYWWRTLLPTMREAENFLFIRSCSTLDTEKEVLVDNAHQDKVNKMSCSLLRSIMKSILHFMGLSLRVLSSWKEDTCKRRVQKMECFFFFLCAVQDRTNFVEQRQLWKKMERRDSWFDPGLLRTVSSETIEQIEEYFLQWDGKEGCRPGAIFPTCYSQWVEGEVIGGESRVRSRGKRRHARKRMVKN